MAKAGLRHTDFYERAKEAYGEKLAQDAAIAAKKEQATAERKRANRIKIRALRSRRSSLFFEEGRETIG